ncbi:MAG: aminotransferase class IV [Flavobacteriales bacterium]|nr:aminotransferase class IV [Flavobacteriales bacterium]MCX7768823.1 aminotransferase class IV [Flavobacteriales bacterium]MDW8410403.1 aminotransferase class IV [Flavobacteriales bacterium]
MLVFNGELVHASEITFEELERGFFYGDGCFETLRLHGGRLPLWTYHLERLKEGAGLLGLLVPQPLESAEEVERLARLLMPPGRTGGRFRLALWRKDGKGRRPVGDKAHWLLQYLGDGPAFFQRLTVHPFPLSRTHFATGPKWLGQREYTLQALPVQEEEAILVTSEGHLCEGLHANIWVVKGDQLITPPLHTGCINGVWRRAVLARRRQWSFQVVEKDVSISVLNSSTPLMMGNALRGFFPIGAYPFPDKWAVEVHQTLWSVS